MLQTVAGLTSAERSAGAPAVFALDLNCAIYHCARKRVQTPYTVEGHDTWEDELIRNVQGYIWEMTQKVRPTAAVYIAVDGVAPMAKIKQQRARRFKSAVLAAEEAAVRRSAASGNEETAVDVGPRWDSNAITPGTRFMSKLTQALHGAELAARLTEGHPGRQVIVSAADEAGEGEQKIMAYLRARSEPGDAVIYGLDADLIVLALQEHARSGRTVDLFREETEFGGGVKTNALGEEAFLYLHTSHLATVLHGAWAPQGIEKSAFLRDFVGLMNLLGNDFVPHGMGLKIHDEGVERVLEAWKAVVGPKRPLVTPQNTYTPHILQAILATLAAQEERWMLRGIRNKLEARVGGSGSRGDAEARAVARMNDRPVEWAAETCLVEQRAVKGEEKPKWFFRRDWREQYRQAALWDACVGDVVKAFCQTLTWTLKYYAGEPVDMSWYYPWFLPPLMEDVAEALVKQPALLALPEALTKASSVLKPVEQLAMVLPLTSQHLLPTPELQTLPSRYPWAWPTGWSYFSLGRRFLWECEPLIPLIQPAQMQRWVEECGP